MAGEGTKAAPELEIKMGEFRIQNRKGQQTYNLTFTVYATLPPPVPEAAGDKPEGEKEAKEAEKGVAGRPEDAAVAAKEAKIKDRVSRTVRSMDPEQFMEADLAGLRGRLKTELCEVMGPDFKIQEVLLTDFACVPQD